MQPWTSFIAGYIVTNIFFFVFLEMDRLERQVIFLENKVNTLAVDFYRKMNEEERIR